MRRCWRRGGCRYKWQQIHGSCPNAASDATKASYTRSSTLLVIRSHSPHPLMCQYCQIQFRSFAWWTSVAATLFAQYKSRGVTVRGTLLPSSALCIYSFTCTALFLRPLPQPLRTSYLYLCSLRIHVGPISRMVPSVGALPAPFQEAGRYCFHSLVL